MLEKLAAKLAGKHPQKSSEEMTNPAFAELIAYVKEHSAEKLSLEQLGKKFGLSAGYICNLFLSAHLRHSSTSALSVRKLPQRR